MNATETGETVWLLPGLALLALFAVVVLIIMADLRQRRRIDRLLQRIERLELRWDQEPRLAMPDPASTDFPGGAPQPAVEPAPDGDVLAGLTSHVRHVVEGDGATAVGLADQAIVGIHNRLSVNLTPADLAAALCVSLRTLERGLAAALDCTPSQLILAMKMREARNMLRSGRYRVSEVADRLGFSSPFHFSRRFKAYYRVPPSELRSPERGER